MKRSRIKQSEHDVIIMSLEKQLVNKGLTIRTNKGTSKDNPVKREDYIFYPDLYVYEGEKVTKIYEVETEDTITEEEAEKQWLPYSMGRAKFFLVVPQNKLEKAKELVLKFKIKVDDYHTF